MQNLQLIIKLCCFKFMEVNFLFELHYLIFPLLYFYTFTLEHNFKLILSDLEINHFLHIESAATIRILYSVNSILLLLFFGFIRTSCIAKSFKLLFSNHNLEFVHLQVEERNDSISCMFLYCFYLSLHLSLEDIKFLVIVFYFFRHVTLQDSIDLRSVSYQSFVNFGKFLLNSTFFSWVVIISMVEGIL